MGGAGLRNGQPSKGTGKLFAATIVSIALSIGGIVYAFVRSVPADGGRGGALALALTFFMLFMGRGTPEDALREPIPDGIPNGESMRVRNALASMLDWQSKEKVYLTISSVCGTIAWGFGDVISAWLSAAVRH
jgi:hypothetical protein